MPRPSNTPRDYPAEGDPQAIAKRGVVRPNNTPNKCSCGNCRCGFERMKRQNRELAGVR